MWRLTTTSGLHNSHHIALVYLWFSARIRCIFLLLSVAIESVCLHAVISFFCWVIVLFLFELRRGSRAIIARYLSQTYDWKHCECAKVTRMITQILINRSWSLINSRWKCDYLAPCNLSADAWSIFWEYLLFSISHLLPCRKWKETAKNIELSSH